MSTKEKVPAGYSAPKVELISPLKGVVGIKVMCPSCQSPVEFARNTNQNHPSNSYQTGTCVCGRVHWVDWKKGEVHMSVDVGEDTRVGVIDYQKHSILYLDDVAVQKTMEGA